MNIARCRVAVFPGADTEIDVEGAVLKTIITTVLAAGLLLGALTAAVAEAPPRPCEAPAFRAFDFWVGKWRVALSDGTHAGINEITRSANGCLLLEQWRSARGTTGTSLNYYDPGKRQWVQQWVGDDGNIIYIAGNIEVGSMVLVGDIYYHGSGQRLPFRGRWTLQQDGRVRQFFEQADAQGENWKPWFEGFYQRM